MIFYMEAMEDTKKAQEWEKFKFRKHVVRKEPRKKTSTKSVSCLMQDASLQPSCPKVCTTVPS